MTTQPEAPWRAHMTSSQPRWEEWQARLPGMVESCAAAWDLEVDSMLTRRVASTLFRVTRRGRRAVLKLAFPGEALDQQIRVLSAAQGRGYVHLYDHDAERGALLLEELGRSMEDRTGDLYAALPAPVVLPMVRDSEFVPVAVQALEEAWTLPAEVAPEPTADTHRAVMLRALIERAARELGLLDEHAAAVETALHYADQRLSAWDPARAVVCHGDPHLGNLAAVLSPRPGAPGGYVFVDPEGFRCEREYDLGVALRGFNRLVLAAEDPVIAVRTWCADLSDRTGTDGEAIWQWALIERVASGLYLIEQGWPERGLPFLDAASWLIARKRR